MKKITIREILIGAVASVYNVSELSLKKVKTSKLREMMYAKAKDVYQRNKKTI